MKKKQQSPVDLTMEAIVKPILLAAGEEEEKK